MAAAATAGVALALTISAPAGGESAPAAVQLSAAATPAELTIGSSLTVTGAVSSGGRPLSGAALELESEPYPYRHFRAIAHATSAADGSFAFSGVKPDRNTRLRVLTEGPSRASSAHLAVVVDPLVAIRARRLRPGGTLLTVRLDHTPEGRPRSVRAMWFTARPRADVFHLAQISTTRELSTGVSYASAVVDPPAPRFVYRVCLNPGWERAMGRPGGRGPCPEHDFRAGRAAR